MLPLNNMLLKNTWVKEEIKSEIKIYIERNENDNATYQNFWDVVKSIDFSRGNIYHSVEGIFINKREDLSLQVYLKKQKYPKYTT